MSSVQIHIKDEIYTTVDSDIAEKIKDKKLFLRDNIKKYVMFKNKGKRTYLHRFIIEASAGQIVDHINRNELDNRRCNLRFVNYSQNSLNKRIKTRSKSGYMRVYKLRNRWQGRVFYNKKYRTVSTYRSRVIAAFFSDTLRKKHSSVMPSLNFQSSIKRCHLPSILRRTKGRIFSVVFIRRKDGAERHMVCRLNVAKNVKGKGLLFTPEQMNLLPVYDVKKKDYRFVPIENVLCLTFRKKKYRVVN
jgi:hypothetical protein